MHKWEQNKRLSETLVWGCYSYYGFTLKILFWILLAK